MTGTLRNQSNQRDPAGDAFRSHLRQQRLVRHKLQPHHQTQPRKRRTSETESTMPPKRARKEPAVLKNFEKMVEK